MLLIRFRSATVDADLFSRYFANCPVITAQGRKHPVTTHFLEEIYERTKYLLAPDSPAALRSDSSFKDKVSRFVTTILYFRDPLFHFEQQLPDFPVSLPFTF